MAEFADSISAKLQQDNAAHAKNAKILVDENNRLEALTAELQKENARLREALQWALARIPAPVKRTRENGDYCDAYEKVAALSKEKAE